MDQSVKSAIRKNPNMAVPWFLITSYTYYHLHSPLVHDNTYDYLCRFMLRRWRRIKHRHKGLIEKQTLSAGTGFYLNADDYPGLAVGAAERLVKEKFGGPIRRRKRVSRKVRRRV